MFINLINAFENAKTKSITTFKHPPNVTLPVSTACIVDLQFEEIYGFNIQKKMITYFKIVNGSKENFLDRNVPWPDLILNVVHSYLVFLTDNEASEATDLTGIRLKLLK